MLRRLASSSGLALATSAVLSLSACKESPLDVEPPASCDLPTQREWILSTMRQVYLWTADLPDEFDVHAYETPEEVVVALRKEGVDRWSRVSDKSTSDALFMEGKYIGTGMSTARDADGRLRISFVHEDSPAGELGVTRGQVIWSVGGKSVLDRDADGDWEDAWGENEPGVSVEFAVHDAAIPTQDVTTADLTTLTVTKDWVQIITVPTHEIFEIDGEKVGYILFWTFVDIAYDELDAAFADFKEQGVTRLVFDMRYNGGGLVAVARYIMNLLAGSEHDGEVSYLVEYNAAASSENSTYRFDSKAYSLPLDRVVFITTSRTASASELVINSVDPWVTTRLIGSVTSGKPVGSHSFEFCETKILYPITFQFTNAAGVNDYYEGLVPDCPATDDLEHQLGDPAEAMTAAAIQSALGQSCAGDGASQPKGPAFKPARLDPVDEALDRADPFYDIHHSH